MDRWEYASIVVYSVDHEQLVETLNNAGAKGWELVAITGFDVPLGGRRLVGVVKRRIDPFDPPDDRAEGWKIDPSDRHGHRYWDGECWTFRVATDGQELRDPPTRLAPASRPQ